MIVPSQCNCRATASAGANGGSRAVKVHDMQYSYVRPVVISLCIIAAAAAGCAIVGLPDAPAQPFARYRLTLEDSDLNVIRVCGSIYGANEKETRLVVTHCDGSEGIDPIGLRAFDTGGRKLPVSSDGCGWVVKNSRRDFTFEYSVVVTIEDGYSPEIRNKLTLLGGDRSRVMGRDVFIVPGIPVSSGVLVDVDLYPAWDMHAAFRSVGRRVIVPRACDLSRMMAVMGSYRIHRSPVCGIDLLLAIGGSWAFTDEELFETIRLIVSSETAMFGSSPHDRYLFICDRNPVKGGGGFDYYGVHVANSMVLLLDPGMDRSELYDTPMALIAHEFFHNWNGEAIRPRSDDLLWFVEGATVYFSYHVLVELSIISREQYEWRRERIASRYLENPCRGRVPIRSAGNSDLGDRDMVHLLYDGGFLAAEALDRKLFEVSHGEAGLLDVLRWLYEHESGEQGVDMETIVRSILEVSGHDLSGFLEMLVGDPAPAVLAGGEQSS